MQAVKLFTPGPVQVKRLWMEKMSEPFMHHRGSDFEALMQRLQPKLQATFQTQQPVMLMAGSGTLAMGAAVVNLFAPGESVLVVSIGYFGDVFATIAKSHGLRVSMLSVTPGQAVNPSDVEQALSNNPTLSGVLITHHETASGVVNDLQAIGKITQAAGVLCVVDAISGLVIHELKMDEWGLDCVLTASQKSYFLPPGIALCAASPHALAKMATMPSRGYYCDWQRYLAMLATKQQTPFTPAIPLIIGLELACDAILAEGLEHLQVRHQQLRTTLQHRLTQLGFQLVVSDESIQGNVLVAVRLTSGARQLVNDLERQGLIVAPGQGSEIETVFRIGCIGDLQASDFELLYTALKNYQK